MEEEQLKRVLAQVREEGKDLAQQIGVLPDVVGSEGSSVVPSEASETPPVLDASAQPVGTDVMETDSIDTQKPKPIRKTAGTRKGRSGSKLLNKEQETDPFPSWESVLGRSPQEGDVVSVKSRVADRPSIQKYLFREGRFFSRGGKEWSLATLIKLNKKNQWDIEFEDSSPLVSGEVPSQDVEASDHMVEPLVSQRGDSIPEPGVTDFILNKDGEKIEDPNLDQITALLEQAREEERKRSVPAHKETKPTEGSVPPEPTPPAEEYSAQEVLGQSNGQQREGGSEQQVIETSALPDEASGIPEGNSEDPVMPGTVPTDSEAIRDYIKQEMETPLPSSEPDDESEEPGRFVTLGTPEAAQVLEGFGLGEREENVAPSQIPNQSAPVDPEKALELIKEGMGTTEESETKKMSFMERLIEELNAARNRYVTVDLEKSSALLRLRNFFGLKKDLSTEDIDVVRNQYDEVRTRYIQARLAEVEAKFANNRGEAYKKAMAETLNFSEFEGRVKLYEARKQAEIEKRAGTLSGKIVEKVAQGLHAYNKLKWYQKLAVGGTLVGVAAAGSAIGGAAFGAAAGAALGRGFLSGGALAVGLDASLELRSDVKARKQVEEREQQIFQEISALETKVSSEPTGEEWGEVEKMEAFAKAVQDFADAYSESSSETFLVKTLFEKRRDGMKMRKLVAGASGVALGLAVGNNWLGSAFGYIREHGIGIGWIDKAFDFSVIAPAEASLGVSENGMLIQTVPPEAVTTPMSSSAALSPISTPEVVPKSASPYTVFQEKVPVKLGDNFWNLMKAKTVDFHLDEGRSRYLIDLIKDKVAALTPEQIKGLGIKSGDIALLQPNEEIDFSRLLTSQELEKYIADAKGISDATAQSVLEYKPSVAKVAAEVAASKGTPAVEAVVTPNRVVPETVVSKTLTFSPEYAPRVDDWYSQIFRVENTTPGQDWVFNREKIFQFKMKDVLQDMQALGRGDLSGYKTGLAPEQYRNLFEFAKEMEKSRVLSMQEFLKGNANGTVGEYFQKVAPRATRGMMYGLFSTSK